MDELEAEVVGRRVVDGCDVGMTQPRGGQRLAREAAAQLVAGSGRGADPLERDAAPQLLVERLVDDPHPAAPDLAHDPVARRQRRNLDGRPVVALLRRGREQPAQRAVGERLVRVAHRARPKSHASSSLSSASSCTVSATCARKSSRKPLRVGKAVRDVDLGHAVAPRDRRLVGFAVTLVEEPVAEEQPVRAAASRLELPLEVLARPRDQLAPPLLVEPHVGRRCRRIGDVRRRIERLVDAAAAALRGALVPEAFDREAGERRLEEAAKAAARRVGAIQQARREEPRERLLREVVGRVVAQPEARGQPRAERAEVGARQRLEVALLRGGEEA